MSVDNAVCVSGASRDDWLPLDDDSLLRQCEQSFVLGSGPGGQKRNKTSNAVRLHHLPSGVVVADCGSRSQLQNRKRAIRKLRLQIAFKFRCAASASDFQWRDVGITHPGYPEFVAALLDVLHESDFSVAAAAAEMQVSTGTLIKTLARDPALWQLVNYCRQQRSLKTLKK